MKRADILAVVFLGTGLLKLTAMPLPCLFGGIEKIVAQPMVCFIYLFIYLFIQEHLV